MAKSVSYLTILFIKTVKLCLSEMRSLRIKSNMHKFPFSPKELVSVGDVGFPWYILQTFRTYELYQTTPAKKLNRQATAVSFLLTSYSQRQLLFELHEAATSMEICSHGDKQRQIPK